MKTKTHVYLYTNVQAALFIAGKREKQARWPPMHEWIKVTCPYNGLRGMEGSKCGHMLQHGWNWKASCWIKVARQTRPHEHTCMQNPKQQVYRERTSMCSCWSWGSLEENGKWILIEVFFFLWPHLLSKWLYSYVNMWKSVDTLNTWRRLIGHKIRDDR